MKSLVIVISVVILITIELSAQNKGLFTRIHPLELAKAVYSKGKPAATVLLNGRPMSVNWLAENATALVKAWFPGEFGGTAVADVLFGDYNHGKLNVSFPKSVGQLPVFYNFKGPNRSGYVDGDSEPLFLFGYGLSYTNFGKTGRN